MNIRTPEDWWIALTEHQKYINRTLELVYVKPDVYNPAKVTLAIAIASKDHELAHGVLQHAWEAAPDKPYIHGWPSWGMLCDLCSEAWVFNPKGENDGP